MMNQPLWRIFLHILLLAFVVQRGAMGFMLYVEGADALLTASFVAQCVAGVVTSFAILLGKRWEVPALITTAVLVAASALYAALGTSLMTFSSAIGQTLVAALAAAALTVALRHEERSGS